MTALFRTVEVSDPSLETDGLRHVTVHSNALAGRADLTLWVPPHEQGPLPIVVLLHGVYGSHWHWSGQGGVHRTAARLVAAGAIPPMVLAMPSDGLWGDGSGYVRLGDRDAATWIVEEVPAAVQLAAPHASTAAGVCLAGLSMGGFGALRLGAQHPDRFWAVSGHSSLTELAQLRAFTDVPLQAYGEDAAQLSVLEPMLRNRDRLPAIRFDCGLDDSLLLPNRRLHAELEAAGVPHVYEEHPGGHDWPYWAEHVADTLLFFALELRRTASGPAEVRAAHASPHRADVTTRHKERT